MKWCSINANNHVTCRIAPPNNCNSSQAVAERTRGNTITVRWERPEITGRDDFYTTTYSTLS